MSAAREKLNTNMKTWQWSVSGLRNACNARHRSWSWNIFCCRCLHHMCIGNRMSIWNGAAAFQQQGLISGVPHRCAKVKVILTFGVNQKRPLNLSYCAGSTQCSLSAGGFNTRLHNHLEMDMLSTSSNVSCYPNIWTASTCWVCLLVDPTSPPYRHTAVTTFFESSGIRRDQTARGLRGTTAALSCAMTRDHPWAHIPHLCLDIDIDDTNT